MPKNEITPEMRLEFEEIRASMAIEGYDVSDANMERAIGRYIADPEVALIPKIKEKADAEGRSFFEVAGEMLGLKSLEADDEGTL